MTWPESKTWPPIALSPRDHGRTRGRRRLAPIIGRPKNRRAVEAARQRLAAIWRKRHRGDFLSVAGERDQFVARLLLGGLAGLLPQIPNLRRIVLAAGQHARLIGR